MYQSRRNLPGIAIFLLFSQMAQMGFNQIPPVTLITILCQVIIFLRLIISDFSFEVQDVCISALTVWYRQDLLRIILGALQHADEWHLYYNMLSMLWKGRILERRLGSLHFFFLIASFTTLCSTMLILLSFLAEIMFQDVSYITQCHVGFSGVLFALKVLINHFEPDSTHYIMGFLPVSSGMACWTELILIHFLVPNSSFIGHLAGILVGLWYLKGPFLKNTIYILASPFTDRHNNEYYQRTSYNNHNYQYQSQPSYNEDYELIRSRRLNRIS